MQQASFTFPQESCTIFNIFSIFQEIMFAVLYQNVCTCEYVWMYGGICAAMMGQKRLDFLNENAWSP